MVPQLNADGTEGPEGAEKSTRGGTTAWPRNVPSSWILTRSASKNTAGYLGSRPRCQAVTSAWTASVTVLIKSGDTSTAYISARHA